MPFSGSEVTQHSPSGTPQMPYGSFSGKSEQPITQENRTLPNFTTLLDGVTVDTNGSAFPLPLKSARPTDDEHVYSVTASSSDFGGGTVTIEISLDDGTTWFTAKTEADNGATFTSTGYIRVPLKGTHVRATLTSSTTPSAVTVRIF